MKDIYYYMNSQDILRNSRLGFDIVLDNSETYDYELAIFDGDYDSQVIDFDNQINYDTLSVNTSLEGFKTTKVSIIVCEIDNTLNDPTYIYSGITESFSWPEFCNHFDIVDDEGTILHYYENFQLNNDVFTYTGFTGETHYFKICGFTSV